MVDQLLQFDAQQVDLRGEGNTTMFSEVSSSMNCEALSIEEQIDSCACIDTVFVADLRL